MFGPLAITHVGPLEMRIVCFVQNCDISSCHNNSTSEPHEQFLKRDFAFVSRYNLSGPVLARYHCWQVHMKRKKCMECSTINLHMVIFFFPHRLCCWQEKKKKDWDNNIVNLGSYHWVQINWWTTTWADCGHHRPWEAAMICFRLFSCHFMSIVWRAMQRPLWSAQHGCHRCLWTRLLLVRAARCYQCQAHAWLWTT